MKREVLFFASNETTHALRFAESAVNHVGELETTSKPAVSVAYIKNQLESAC